MIRVGEKPWEGTFHSGERNLTWVAEEPLWDGTPVWRLEDKLRPSGFLELLKRIQVRHADWLDDMLLWGGREPS